MRVALQVENTNSTKVGRAHLNKKLVNDFSRFSFKSLHGDLSVRKLGMSASKCRLKELRINQILPTPR